MPLLLLKTSFETRVACIQCREILATPPLGPGEREGPAANAGEETTTANDPNNAKEAVPEAEAVPAEVEEDDVFAYADPEEIRGNVFVPDDPLSDVPASHFCRAPVAIGG